MKKVFETIEKHKKGWSEVLDRNIGYKTNINWRELSTQDRSEINLEIEFAESILEDLADIEAILRLELRLENNPI